MLEIKLLPDSEIEIIGEINSNDFMSARPQALKEIRETVEIDGFRKGKAPEGVLIKKIGAEVVLEKMAVVALEEFYPKIIEERKIRAIGRPEIIITKIAENNSLGFKIKTSVLPEITLPDYREIAKNIARQATKEEEVSAEGQLTQEKKIKEKEKRRMEILDKVAESIEQEMPKYLIEIEKEKMIEEIKRNIEQAGLNWNDYLKHVKKTEEEIANDLGKEATKRVKYGLILEEIAGKEKIEVADNDLEKEVNAMMEYHKNLGQDLDKERVKNYLSGTMRNEKLFQLLEKEGIQ